MRGFLLDTKVLSEFNRRGDPDPLVKQWLEAADPNSLSVSVVTLGEVRLGVELLPQGKRRTQLEQWMHQDLRGRPLPVLALIAATAFQLTLQICRVIDFRTALGQDVGITILPRARSAGRCRAGECRSW